jgi:hypothetical protein
VTVGHDSDHCLLNKWFKVQGFKVQPSRQPKKLPVKSKKKL